jgi:opacity protein-like surface antigen
MTWRQLALTTVCYTEQTLKHMRPKTFFFIAAGIIPLAASAAGNDWTDRFYVSTDVGPAFQQGINIIGADEIKFNTGVRGDVSLGYRFAPWIATELAAGFIWNSADSIGGVPISSYGGSLDLYEIPLMGNLILTTPAKHGFQPYVGGGVGVVAAKLDFTSPLGDIHDTDYTFSYQAMAGVNYQLSQNLVLGLGYKYLCTRDHSWTENGVTLDTEGTATHSVTLSLTWSF